MLKKPTNILFFLIVLALVLRLGGISHGFPFIFHPDESTVVRSALAIRFDTNPGHFDWPHLYIYLNYLVYMVFAFVRDLLVTYNLKDVAAGFLPAIWDEGIIFYLITRIMTALFGAFTLIPVYLAGKKLFNEKVGLLSAFGYATFQSQVWYSHYTMPDTAMVFFLSWGIYYCAKILTEKDFANYVLAGFFFGLSASTKYNGGMGVLLVPLAHLLGPLYAKLSESAEKRCFGVFNTFALLFSSALFTVLGFVIGTPYSVLDYKNFIRTDGPGGALWQFTNVGTFIAFQRIGLVFDRVFNKVGDGVSYIALVGVLIVFVTVLVRIFLKQVRKFDVSLILLLIPIAFFLFYVAGHEKSRSHYFMIVYPLLALIFGYFVNLIFVFVRRKNSILSFLVLSMLLLPSLLHSSISSLSFINNDTRVDLSRWAKNYLTGKESIEYDAEELKKVISGITTNSKKESEAQPWEVYDYYVSGENRVPGEGYTKILDIDDRYRLGPKITVYKRNL
jgi:4-amino-4-deoxy-L-arabinose transferase-like glycosyltransferase